MSDELELYLVDDGEMHYAVAANADEAVDEVARAMLGDRETWELKVPAWETSTLPWDREFTVTFDDQDTAREISEAHDGLSYEEDGDWHARVTGPVSAWVEVHAEDAPSFVASSVF